MARKLERAWIITARADDPKTGRYICWAEYFDRRKDAERFLAEKGWRKLRGYKSFRATRASIVFEA